jgi:glycosyltransferase involved in cell wall biosynthesis
MNVLYIVVPCYNEAEVLPTTAERLLEKLNDLIRRNLIGKPSRILFVDDGSKDETWAIIQQLYTSDNAYSGIRLAHNGGQQNALLAGLMTAKEYADMVLSIDADLQDDLEAIEDMVNEYIRGNDIVYGVRSSRKSDSFLRRFTAENFYRVMTFLGVDVVFNSSSCRLLSKKALEALSEYKEVNVFLPGIVPLLGLRKSFVRYERKERFAGKTKYSFKQLFALASQAITSFSLKPLRWVVGMWILMILISFKGFMANSIS